MSIKNSLKTTWWLFTANNDSPKSVALSRFALVATPIILGLGVATSFAVALNPIVGVFMGITTGILVGSSMLKSSRATRSHVESYLMDDDQDIIGSTDYVMIHRRTSSTGQTLAFFQSWGEWMSVGHVPLNEFIIAVQDVDPLARSLPEETLIDQVQYHYAQSYYSKSLDREALRLVHKTEPDCFPITRLVAPSDLVQTKRKD